MSDKKRFHEAIKFLRLTTGVLPAEGRKNTDDALETAERFAGSLRREASVLKRENEACRKDIATLRDRVEERESKMAHLERQAREQRSGFERQLREALETGIRLPHGDSSGAEFAIIKAKCLACSLHFILCTDSSERHSGATLHCPECGQHDGGFLTWSDTVKGMIFQLVPGQSDPFSHPNLDAVWSMIEPENHGPSFTVMPSNNGIDPRVMAKALRKLYDGFHAQYGRRPPEGTLIHEDHPEGGKVQFFAFSVRTGGGGSIDGCAVPHPDKSREEQVRDLIKASLGTNESDLEFESEM